MSQYLPTATRIPAPGGTLIEEYVGRVNSGTYSESVARMRARRSAGRPSRPNSPTATSRTLSSVR